MSEAPTAQDLHQQDVQLMQMVAAGDSRARRMLAMRTVGKVRKIAHAMVNTTADAEDAAQQSLIAIMRSAGSYRGDSSLDRWVRRVAVRHILRHARSSQQRRQQIDGNVDPDALHSVFGHQALADSLPRPITAYLEELPEHRRQALVLKHALGYSVSEIAELTDTPPSTVKYHINTALKDIRSAIRRDCLTGAPTQARPS